MSAETVEQGRALIDADESAEAVELLLKAAADEPENATVQALLGNAYARQANPSLAERHFTAALKLDPTQFDALLGMAAVCNARQAAAGAVAYLERAEALQPSNNLVLHQLGLAWLSQGEGLKAAELLRKVVLASPESPEIWSNLGTAYAQCRSYREAFHAFRRVTEQEPGQLNAYLLMASQMPYLLNWHEGLPVLERGLDSLPPSAPLIAATARAHGKLGHAEEAERLFRQAVSMDPTANIYLAEYLQEEGRFSDSIEILMEGVNKRPHDGVYYFNLTLARSYEVAGKPIDEVVRPLLARRDLVPFSRLFMLYAVAKTLEHRGRYKDAFQFFEEANGLAYSMFCSKERFSDRAAEDVHRFQSRLFNRNLFRKWHDSGSRSKVPIFIVGMIRSGTTMLDRILASHPQVSSAGEQPFFQICSAAVSQRWAKQGVRVEDLELLEAQYLEALNRSVGEAPRIVDKMPMNYQNLGLIRLVFPEAKIIHLRRNPIDTAVSIYTTYLGPTANFAYDRNNIVGTYRSYRQTMRLWREVLPSENFLEMEYEQLVADPETTVRGLLAFCELNWDDACLRHSEATAGPVSTPSVWTARQPINRNSVDRWKLYEPWLGELAELGLLETAETVPS